MGIGHRRVAPGVAVVLCAALMLVGGAQNHASALGDAEAQLLRGMNAARAANDLPPMRRHSELATVAAGWSARMRDDYVASGDAGGALRHNPSVFDQISHSYTRAAENVGYAYGDDSSARLADRVLGGFMSSPGHRANILGKYTSVGVGLARAGDGTLFVTVVFTDGAVPETPEPEPEHTDRRTDPSTARDVRDADASSAAPSEPARAPRPDPAHEAVLPAAPTVEELFGAGWPEGYLVGGGRSSWPDWLLSVPGHGRFLLLGLINGFGAAEFAPE